MTIGQFRRSCGYLISLVLFASAFLGCTGGDPVQPEPQAIETPTPAADAPVDGAESAASQNDGENGGQDDGESGGSESNTPAVDAGPTIDDDDLVEIVQLDAGDQVEDEQGNLVVVYGFAEWPETFANLPVSSREMFPFFADLDSLGRGDAELIALDVGMCAAGIDASGFGTAEFFVRASEDEPLSTDAVLDRGVLARHPVRPPGFGFPAPAECARGWLPAIWSRDEDAAVARYLLTTRPTSTAPVERRLYQWTIALFDSDPATDAAASGDAGTREPVFDPGQTVTFNDGALADTTVVVDGWTERVGAPSTIERTRIVAVSLTVCPSNDRWPEFGIGLDGWNLTAPLDPTDRFGAENDDPESGQETCFDGWLDFAVPYGSVPTSFFASDGRDPIVGFAEWSLANAALPAPQ